MVVWLQGNRSSTTIDTSPITDIINSLKTFFSVEQCINFIESTGDTKIFFISSHSNNDMVLEKVSDYSQIIAIYILQIQEELIERSPPSNVKLHGIYSNVQSLCEELSKEYDRRRHCSQIPMSVFLRDKNQQTVRDLSKDNVQFLWFQLLIDILTKIPHNDQAKDEMLRECRKHYGIPCNEDGEVEEDTVKTPMNNNKNAEKDILNFKMNYKPTEALKFYTNDSFLYRLFNQAFRTENIDLLFIFRFFLADMYKQLQTVYSEQFPDKLSRTVFRGQTMTNLEFDSIKNNIGRLVSLNTFFSTSTDRDVALIYADFGAAPDPMMQSVLFKIEVDVTHSTVKRPFASISDLSTIPDEQEVMFSVGSMFCIESVRDKRTTDGHWYVNLKLVEDDNDINELRNELEKELCDKGDLCSLGIALKLMGDHERAERYFRMLLEYIPEDNSNIGRIYSFLGVVTYDKGDYRASLSYHEKALEYFNKLTNYDVREPIGREYVHIGSSHHQLGNLDLAKKYYTMATDIQTSPKLLAYTYNQIALIYRDKGDKRLALEYFQKILYIDEQVLKINQYQPELATIYNNIGEIYDQLGDNENALKYLEHALDIRLKGTVSTHKDLAAIYINLAKVYRDKKELKKALELLEKALEIETRTFGNNYKPSALTHNNIGAIYHEMNDLARTLYHSETSLRILLHSQATENSADIFQIQYNIGVLQFNLGNNIKALKITRKALENQLRIFPENHESFARTYLLLSQISEQQQDKPTALEYIEKGIEIARVSILPHDKIAFQDYQH